MELDVSLIGEGCQGNACSVEGEVKAEDNVSDEAQDDVVGVVDATREI